MLQIILMLLYLSSTSSEVDDQPYCALRYRRLCQGKGTHVGCQFPNPEPGPYCQNYTQIKFTRDLKHFVIHYINRRRQRIAAGNERVRGGAHLPKPQIMMLVGWDRELALLAQRLADQCQFVHDDCRSTVRFPYAGQSVGEVRWRRSSASDELTAQRAARRVLDAWWGERRRAQPHQLTAPFKLTTKGSVWGHFSQLAVWTLRAVGCGAARHGWEYPRMLLVCDFSHTNMLGQRTLAPGPLASCPLHTIRRPRSAYPLLCAPIKRPNSEEKKTHEITEHYIYDEEEDGIDDGVIVQTAEVRTTTRTKIVETTTPKREKTTQLEKQYRPRITVKPNDVYNVSDKKSTRVIEKLQHELEINNSPKGTLTMRTFQQWVTRRRNFGRLRENQEYATEQDAQNNLVTRKNEVTAIAFYKKFTPRRDYTTSQVSNVRQRWKQTRLRPQRPGVNALLNRSPEKFLRRSSVCSLMLDQDDVDQLFRDTGFNVNWRKQSSPK